ncbi:MAG: hypothetical protein ACXWQO_03410 [Bdellovibrionota bacterium]
MFKLFPFIFLFWASIGAVSAAELAVQPLEKPGEYLVQKAWARFSIELDKIYRHREPLISKEETWLIEPMTDINSFGRCEIQFAQSTDPRLNLAPGEPPRTASTKSTMDSPIVFNRDLINRPGQFAYADAVRMLVHELGHKVNTDISGQIPNYQATVDRFAAKVASITASEDIFESVKLGGKEYEFFVHSSFGEDLANFDDDPNGKYRQQSWPLIFLQDGQSVYDLSEGAYALLVAVNKDSRDDRIFNSLVLHEAHIEPVGDLAVLRLKFSYQLHSKKTIERFGTRYIGELEVPLSLNQGKIMVDTAHSSFSPAYFTDHSVAWAMRLNEKALAQRSVQFDLELTSKGASSWYIRSVEAVFLVNGRKRVVQAEGPDDLMTTILHVSLYGLGPEVRSVRFLGINMAYSLPVSARQGREQYQPWDHFFVPDPKVVEFKLP